ncbi:hypothetical protein ACOMHN_015463 [Nucella lapillus]
MSASINRKLRDEAGELASDFRTVAKQLDDHMNNVNIARVTGGSAGIFGGILAITGVVMIPFTMGTSALLAAGVGASIATAGGLTSGGASIVMGIITKFSLDPLLKKWDAFSERLNKELKKMDRYAFEKLKDEAKESVDRVKVRVVQSTVGALDTGIQAAREMRALAAARGVAGAAARGAARGAAGAAARGAARGAAGAAARGAARGAAGAAARGAAREAGRVVASASVILNVALIGLSVYDIIDGAIQLQSETGTRAGDCLRELAQSLDDFSKNGRIEDFLK